MNRLLAGLRSVVTPSGGPISAAAIGGLLSIAVAVGGLSAVWQPSPRSDPLAQWAPVAAGEPCRAEASDSAGACELLMIVHLLAEATPAPTESKLTRVEAVLARVPGVVGIRVFGDAADAPSTRSLLNNEPAMAIAIFRGPDADASAVAGGVRRALARLGDGHGENSSHGADSSNGGNSSYEEDRSQHAERVYAADLRWAIAYDTTRFAAHSSMARIAASLDAVWRGARPASEPRYLVAFAQLPDGASLDRTDALLRRMSEIAFTHPGIESALAFVGRSIDGTGSSSNAGLVFLTLRPSAAHGDLGISATAIAVELNQRFARIDGAVAAVLPPAIGQRHAASTAEAPRLAAVFTSGRDDKASLLANVDPRHPGP